MDCAKYQEISEKSELENEVRVMFKNTVTFLRKFSVCLLITKGEDRKLILGCDLAEISNEFLNFNEFVWFDTKQVYQRFISELSKGTNIETDVNTTVLQLLSNCLLYIISLLQDENANVMEIFKYFLDLKKCIFIFSSTPVILDTNKFRSIVGHWIVDLLKVITHADGIARNDLKYLKVYNLITQILTHLSRCNVYCDMVIKEICKKLACALSYYAANEEFRMYMDLQCVVFEYLLWIMKSVVTESAGRAYSLDYALVLRIRQILEMLAKCQANSCMIRDLISDIVMVF